MKLTFDKCNVLEGLDLSSMKTDKFKTAVFKLSIAMPATVDEMDTALFALMVNVLKCGTEKYPEKADLIKRLGDLYDASCSIGGYASGDNRIFEISSEMLSDKFSAEGSILEGVVELADQLLYHPLLDNDGDFPSDTVEREKQVICDKIRSEKNNSRAYALKKCRAIMCQGEPYGCSVKSEVIIKITPKELTAYYRDFLSHAVPSFSYVGDKEISDVAKTVEKYFCGESFGCSVPIAPLSCVAARDVRRCDEELDVKQGILVMGFRSGILLGERFSEAMRVFNNIFGGTCTSRLFTVIREKMGLCYYCDSDYVSTKGILFVCSGIDSDNREITENEILRQLDLLREERVSDVELKSAKDMAIKELREMGDYQASIASFKYAYEVYGCDCDIDNLIARITSVTADDITAIARMITLDTVFFLKGNGYCSEEDYDYE